MAILMGNVGELIVVMVLMMVGMVVMRVMIVVKFWLIVMRCVGIETTNSVS